MLRATSRVAPSAVFLLLALSACGTGQDEREALSEEIAINRSVWEAQRPDHYRFVLSRRCFCPQEAIGPVELEVEGSLVLSRTYVAGGDPVPEDLRDAFPTVSGLFDVLSEAVATGADEITVTWNPINGAPAEFFIDYDVDTADEELGFAIEEGPEEIPEEEPLG